MDNKVHVLAKNGLFLFRFNDGEFGSKWCGLWKKETKYLDYFAFKLNGTFLSSENATKLDFYNSQFARLSFQTKDGVVTEEVACLDDSIIITLRPAFKAVVSTEMGVNIRDRSDNYAKGKRYELFDNEGKIAVSFYGKTLYIMFDKGKFSKNEFYGIHVPGMSAKERGFSRYFDDCSTQNKYVPGSIDATLDANEEINFVISIKDLDKDNFYKILKNRIGRPKEYSDILNKIYSNFGNNNIIDSELIKDSIDSLYSYSNFTEKEIYAGYPYFNQFWLRDALLILPSFLSINNAGFVKSILEKIAGSASYSGLPAIFGDQSFTLDVAPSFIICLYEYFKWTGDINTVKMLKEQLNALLDSGRSVFEHGIIHDAGRASWMDSIDREYSIEIQALWIKAFEYGAELNSLMNEEVSDLENLASQIKENLVKYKREGYFSDQLNRDINSANQLFLTFHGVVDEKDANLILENAKNNLLGEFGVHSVSDKDKIYDPKGYHTGSIWPFLTNVLAGSAFLNGDYELGKTCIKILQEKNLGAQCESRITELFEPSGKPQGCSSQAWSIGMLPYIIDRFALGIEVNASKNEIHVKYPHKEINAKRTLLINEKEVKLEFSDGELNSNKKMIDEGDYIRIII
jgi:glycogen debranching enzyme